MPITTIRLPEDNSYRHRFLLKDDADASIDLGVGVLTLLVYLKRTRVLVDTWAIGVELTVIGDDADGVVDLLILPNTLDPGVYLLVFHYAVGADVWEENAPDLMVFQAL